MEVEARLISLVKNFYETLIIVLGILFVNIQTHQDLVNGTPKQNYVILRLIMSETLLTTNNFC